MAAIREPSIHTSLGDVLLKALSGNMDAVSLASPFLTRRVAQDLADLVPPSVDNWRLIIKLDAAAVAHGSLSTDAVRKLLDAGVKIRTHDHLHAKLTLIGDSAGFLGSANLTNGGLNIGSRQGNLELSVELTPTDARHCHGLFGGWWKQSAPVTKDLLKQVEDAASFLPSSIASPPIVTGDPRALSKVVSANALLDDARGASNLWVKALYRDAVTADETWEEGYAVTSSKRGRPSFEIGDLLILYAKQASACSTIVEVIDESEHNVPGLIADGRSKDQAERWPWLTPVKPRVQIPIADGFRLEELGFSGRSLQGGHKRIGIGEFTQAVKLLHE